MADTGFVFPGTGASRDNSSGPSWGTPGNCTADDASNATVVSSAAAESDFLDATNFGFATPIPAGATIDGIEVQVGDYDLVSGTWGWAVCKLKLADASEGSENKSAALASPTTSLQTDEAGGASDLWGETISRADVIDVDWGFTIGLVVNAFSRNLRVDFCRMKVFYTEGGGNGGASNLFKRQHIGFLYG